MNFPNAANLEHKKGGFNFRIILASIFIFLGILVFAQIFYSNIIKDIPAVTLTLKYGTALGSIIGGFFMLIKKKHN